MNEQELYRKIPKMDKLMETPEIKRLTDRYGYSSVSRAARTAEENLRGAIRRGEEDAGQQLERLPEAVRGLLEKESRKQMQKVINATGVILHTNLGRAPLGRETAEEIAGLMTGYTNLEFHLEDGKRGSRYEHFADALCALTGAEAALAVNNNAAAVLVILAALTSGREAIVSRGELVEVGGKFRIPDVMAQSGTRLVEVGCTNRTYTEDYLRAVTPDTAAFLKVHTSNYRISGFTCEASIEELAEKGRALGIPVLVDLGSGSLTDPDGKTSVRRILDSGADLVCFSGDKLFGGPQAGILLGRRELIEKISSHPLMRAVRIDKFTAAALDATVRIYLNDKEPWKKIPALGMMRRTAEELGQQAEALKKALSALEAKASLKVVETRATVGGGSMPGEEFPSMALSIQSAHLSPAALAEKLRLSRPPVIPRIENDCLLLDMCTVFPEETELIARSLLDIFS